MGRSSSAKKVARAARAGRGRRSNTQRSLLFPASLAVVIVLGIALVLYANNEQDASADDSPPQLSDHFHIAYGINICGDFQPALRTTTDPLGIHTHDTVDGSGGDGVIHIHPFSNAAVGRKATLDKFLDLADVRLTDDELETPNRTISEDEECPEDSEVGSGPAMLRAAFWENAADDEPTVIYTEDFGDIPLNVDRGAITIFFGPEDAEIEKPPSVPMLDNLSDVDPTDLTTPTPGSTPPSDSNELEIPIPTDGTDATAPADTSAGSATTAAAPATTAAADTTGAGAETTAP